MINNPGGNNSMSGAKNNTLMKEECTEVKSKFDLDIHGIKNPSGVHWNLTTEQLVEAALERNEGVLTASGALSCVTGEHTGRSPKDKFTVRDSKTENTVDWGKVNAAMTTEQFEQLRKDQLAYLEGKELFVRDAFAGADNDHVLKVRVINETAWHNLFAKTMFIRPETEDLLKHKPDFTVIQTPGFEANPEIHGTRSKTFIAVNFSEGLVLIGGTSYAGEIKKSIFSVLNFLYPEENIFPMHCSANVDANDSSNTALFFGLSGTGKTTLSADPKRRLIGDDEHGWGNNGVFNFEGGCYAKCIDLTKEKEPEIWAALRDGAILENVVVDESTKTPDYSNVSLTENTRGAYPIDHIEGAIPEGRATHPKNIVFLTCDAFGVMPPIAKLTPEQAMYHFLSGYTAKVAGTEKGMGNSPQATFSACFGSPFLPRKPTEYAEMLGQKMQEHDVDCWLVNTGWVGGAYGVGERIKLSYTRRIVEAAVNGELKGATFEKEDYFGLQIPTEIKDVPSDILNPKNLWEDKNAYGEQITKLSRRFIENFKKFEADRPDLKDAGPKID